MKFVYECKDLVKVNMICDLFISCVGSVCVCLFACLFVLSWLCLKGPQVKADLRKRMENHLIAIWLCRSEQFSGYTATEQYALPTAFISFQPWKQIEPTAWTLCFMSIRSETLHEWSHFNYSNFWMGKLRERKWLAQCNNCGSCQALSFLKPIVK